VRQDQAERRAPDEGQHGGGRTAVGSGRQDREERDRDAEPHRERLSHDRRIGHGRQVVALIGIIDVHVRSLPVRGQARRHRRQASLVRRSAAAGHPPVGGGASSTVRRCRRSASLAARRARRPRRRCPAAADRPTRRVRSKGPRRRHPGGAVGAGRGAGVPRAWRPGTGAPGPPATVTPGRERPRSRRTGRISQERRTGCRTPGPTGSACSRSSRLC
jgi:hypothetical protein